VKMNAGRPDTESPESREGSATHEIAARMIDNLARAITPAPGVYIGSVVTNGHVITAEEYDAAVLYAQDVAAVMQATRVFGGNGRGIERLIGIPEIHPQCSGTPDADLYVSGRALYLWDYKHGHGIVEPYENLQIVAYLAGLITLYGINGAQDQRITVHARIVQPRGFHRDGPIREWSCLLSDIRPLINKLRAAAEEALGPSPRIISGAHCRYCRARHECPSARESALTLYEATGAAIPEALPAAALGSLYALIKRAAAQIECMESGVEEQIKARIRAGESIPGCIVEEGVGREAWSHPTAEIIALGDMMGVELRVSDVCTPAQAKKKGLDPTIVTAYTSRPSTGFKVVVDNNLKARSVFNGK
jgi:hypothetical protein